MFLAWEMVDFVAVNIWGPYTREGVWDRTGHSVVDKLSAFCPLCVMCC